MITAKKRPYDEAVEFLPMFKDKLSAVAPNIREKAREIRLRAGQPITIELIADRHIINTKVTAEDLKKLIEIFCDYSIHSYARQISQGFITLKGGHRAGFCGKAVIKNDLVTAMRDISSVNLRIAREFIGCSDELYNAIHNSQFNNLKSLLIMGKPMSAKTTVLRDMARNLSDAGYKVAVIDERGEINAPGFNLGMNTDVLDGFPKKAGFITALRALSPDFILCDEIAGDGEDIAECLNCGVGVIMTAHCGSIDEAFNSFRLSGIMKYIDCAALLGTGKNIGRLEGLYKRGNKNENTFCNILPACGNSYRLIPFGGA
jgi:stage III sporulation protein AA